MESPCVYILRSEKANKVYIGSTKNIDKRMEAHFIQLKTSTHHNFVLQEIWDKYHDVQLVMTLPYPTERGAQQIEEVVIDLFMQRGLCVNIGLSAVGGDNLTMHPRRSEIIEKMTRSLKVRFAGMSDDERREKYGRSGELNGMFGRTHTDEVKVASSIRNKGNTYCLGFKHGPEYCAKRSEIGKAWVGEKNGFFGKTHSEETREILRQQKLGSVPANAKFLSIDGTIYRSAKAASRVLGIGHNTIRHRTLSKNPKYATYFYVDEMEQSE